ncbi:hypothetical protein Y717_33245 [Streptomyces scopuliridis RB72]|uniref:Uncharacterized protein n=1 Tax=Streptomyces scopuliridis RB72 TaxID=1440053 RepID=A0A2T7T3R8_9ACTN|nr:hypothetical protein Y717_33245 [Streptomyces scopuliridis RB72]
MSPVKAQALYVVAITAVGGSILVALRRGC